MGKDTRSYTMADLANSEDMLNSEAVLDIFRKLPLLNFNPMVKPPEIPSHVPPRGWLSSNTSDLPTKFRVVETIWPELIETIKTYIDLGGIKAHLLGPRSYFTSKMSHCLEDMAPVPWQPRDGTGFPTSADVNEYVIGPMQILSEDIRQSRITGQSGDTVPKMKWMHLFPFNTHTTIRTLPDLHLHEANPTINSIKGPMCATIALLPFFELPSEAIDSIDACLAHPETVADSCGMVCCPLDDSAIASSLITRVWWQMSYSCSPWGVFSDTKRWWVFKANYDVDGGCIDVQRIDWLPTGLENPWTLIFALTVYNYGSLRRPMTIPLADVGSVDTPEGRGVDINFTMPWRRDALQHNDQFGIASFHAQGPLDVEHRDTIDLSVERSETTPSIDIHQFIESGHTWDAYRGTMTRHGSDTVSVIVKFTTPAYNVGGCCSQWGNLEYMKRVEADVATISHLDRVLPGVGPKWYGLFRAILNGRDTWVVIVEDAGIAKSHSREMTEEDCVIVEEKYRQLHASGIIHGSVSLKHVLWRPDRDGIDQIRLIDFERARYKDDLDFGQFKSWDEALSDESLRLSQGYYAR